MILKKLKTVADRLRRKTIPPKIVKSVAHARYLTRCDPCGRVWTKGEKYYEFNLTADGSVKGFCPLPGEQLTTQDDPVMDEYIRLSTEMMRLEEDYVNPPREKP